MNHLPTLMWKNRTWLQSPKRGPPQTTSRPNFQFQATKASTKNRLHKKGGGIICYVKNKYPAVKITKEDSEKYDTVYVELETSKHNNITIGTVYRPPKQQAADDAALYEEIHTKQTVSHYWGLQLFQH